MCTVTYLPLANSSWDLTTNRDESPLRPADAPAIHLHNGKRLLYPRDPLANGSWTGVSESGRAGCILNGAFVRHERKPPYRKSRGLILLDFLSSDNSNAFFKEYDLNGIEPFTLVGVDDNKPYELRWDEEKKHLVFPDPLLPQLWASATLYPPEWIEKRHEWFNKWLAENPVRTRSSIVDFHLKAGEGNPMYDLVMNRYDLVRTLSITSTEKNETGISMQYHDLLNGKEITETLHS